MTHAASTPEERAAKRAEDLTGLYWHLAAFIVVNVFLWALDWIQGGGLQWAYFITLFWGIGLVFHIASYLIDDSGFTASKYQQFLEEEKERQA